MQGFLIAICRIIVGGMFFVFGFSKLFQPLAYSGKSFVDFFPNFVQQCLTTGHPYAFWRPFLEHVVAPHPAYFAWGVGVGELLIGVSLILGYWTRLSSFFGILLISSIHFCQSPFSGDTPFWTQVAATMQHLPIALLFVIFAATNAGQTLGFDGKSPKKAKAPAKEKSE